MVRFILNKYLNFVGQDVDEGLYFFHFILCFVLNRYLKIYYDVQMYDIYVLLFWIYQCVNLINNVCLRLVTVVFEPAFSTCEAKLNTTGTKQNVIT